MIKKLILLTTFVLAAALAAVPQTRRTNLNFEERIIGGHDAPEGQYPYQVSVRYRGNHMCGGSILNNEWILTAGSCVFAYNNLTVYVGSNQRSTGGTIHEVLEATYHEDFPGHLFNVNDVAVIRIAPISFTNKVSPIALDFEGIIRKETGTLTGWGILERHDDERPENLQEIELKIITNDECKEHFGNRITDGHICTLMEPFKGSCDGDRGGPLVTKDNGNVKQIGIMSLVWSPCATIYPDMFTKISSYIPWIRQACNNCI